MTEQSGAPDSIKAREERLAALEAEVADELKPRHEEVIEKVHDALAHLAAATADLEEVRRVERLAGRR